MPHRSLIAAGFLVILASGPAPAAPHTHTSPDGRETDGCTCRPATAFELRDPAIAPDGWVQDEPREIYRRGNVPLPLVPDWTGTRIRATGGLCWGDIDNDNDEDLVIGTYWANQYPPLADYYNFAYLNNGGVLEANPSWISVDQKHTTDVKAGRINSDSYLDFFFANGGESLQPSQVFYGQNGMLPTSAGWTSATSVWAIGAAAADFDRDGDLDVATANQGNSGNPYRPAYVYRNGGNGLETTPFWQSAQIGITNSCDWGDMDDDGWLDLAVAGWSSWQTGVFRNTQAGSLTTSFVWTTNHPERTDKGIGWALVNDDPYPDLAVGGNGAPSWLFLNEGTALPALPAWESAESYHGTQELAWVDVDGDGDPDLATIHFATGHVRIHLNNNGVLPTIADWQYDAASSGTALAFGDINGDGDPDLAIGVANGPILVFVNTGVPAAAEDIADLRSTADIRISASPQPGGGPTRLRFSMGTSFRLDRVSIFNVDGRLVESWSPGTEGLSLAHEITWDGGTAGAGVYFVRAEGSMDGRTVAGSRRTVKLSP